MCIMTEAESNGSRAEARQRLDLLIDQDGNSRCADCPDHSPQFVCLLQQALVDGDAPMGVFCCGPCARVHKELGKNVCTVKSIHGEFTLEQVECLEQSGNQFVHSLLQATPSDGETDRETLIRNKYRYLDSQLTTGCAADGEGLHQQKKAVRNKANHYAMMMKTPKPLQQSRTDRLLNRQPSNQNLMAEATDVGESAGRQTPARAHSGTSIPIGGRRGSMPTSVTAIQDENQGPQPARRRTRASMDHRPTSRGGGTSNSPIRRSPSDPFLMNKGASSMPSKVTAIQDEGRSPKSAKRRTRASMDHRSTTSRRDTSTSPCRGEAAGDSAMRRTTSDPFLVSKGTSSSRKEEHWNETSINTNHRSRSTGTSQWGLVKTSLRDKESRRELLQNYRGDSDSEQEDERNERRPPSRQSSNRALGSLSRQSSNRALGSLSRQSSNRALGSLSRQSSNRSLGGSRGERESSNRALGSLSRQSSNRSMGSRGEREPSTYAPGSLSRQSSNRSLGSRGEREPSKAYSSSKQGEQQGYRNEFPSCATASSKHVRKSSRKSYSAVGSDSESDCEVERRSCRKSQLGIRSSSKRDVSSRDKQDRSSSKRSSSSKWSILKSSLRNKESRRGLLESYNSISDSEDEADRRRQPERSASSRKDKSRSPTRSSERTSSKSSSSKWGVLKKTLGDEQSRQKLLRSYSTGDSDSEEDREPRKFSSSHRSSGAPPKSKSSVQDYEESLERTSSNKDLVDEDRKERRRDRNNKDTPSNKNANTADSVDLDSSLVWDHSTMRPATAAAETQSMSSSSLVLSKDDRLVAVLGHPDNQKCSECAMERPTWASFFMSPVDGRRLGVLCCGNCYDLHQKVGEGEFLLKDVRSGHDCNEKDVETLEMSGNKVVNMIYEANVLDDRVKQEHGPEAHFFEKYMNLSYFNGRIYDVVMSDAMHRASERRKAMQLERLHRSWEEAPKCSRCPQEKERRVTRAASGSALELVSKLDREERGRSSRKKESNRRSKRSSSGNTLSQLSAKLDKEAAVSRKLSPKRDSRSVASSSSRKSRLDAKDNHRLEASLSRLEALNGETKRDSRTVASSSSRKSRLDAKDHHRLEASMSRLETLTGETHPRNSSPKRHGESDRRSTRRHSPR